MEYISATIITYNEATRISECLDSLRIGSLVDEIVVVDSGSTDDTAEICRRAGCRVYVRPFNGYGIQRQFATSLTSNNFVISIDADERLSAELADAILAIKQKGFEHRVYAMPTDVYIMGRKVHTGEGVKTPIRLFNKRYAQWNLDDVGERLTFPTSLQPQMLGGRLMHHRAADMDELYSKELHKASIAAGNAPEDSVGAMIPALKGVKKFCKQYFSNRGFLDGAIGLTIARTEARAVRDAYRQLRRKKS